MEEYKGKFEDIKVGDQVIYHPSSWGSARKVGTVTKTTAKYFEVDCGSGRYRKSDGYQAGGDSYARSYVTHATEEQITEIKNENHRYILGNFLNNYNFWDLDIEALKEIYNLVKSKTEKEDD